MSNANSQSQHQPNQFTTDEYVLAYHGPLLYEARVSCLKRADGSCTSFEPTTNMLPSLCRWMRT